MQLKFAFLNLRAIAFHVYAACMNEFLITIRSGADFDRKRRIWRLLIIRDSDVELVSLQIGDRILCADDYRLDQQIGEIRWLAQGPVPKELIARLRRNQSPKYTAAWIAFWGTIAASTITLLAKCAGK